MQSFLLFVRKFRIAFMLVSFVLVVVAIIAISKGSPQVSPGTTPIPRASSKPNQPQEPVVGDWGSLNEIVVDLGQPLNDTKPVRDGRYEYKTKSASRNTEVVFNNNTPVFLKEVVTEADNKTAQGIKKKYGEPTLTMYGSFSEFGFNLYAYPDKGIAYLGNPKTDGLMEIWYFAPTDNETFTQTWAIDYTLSDIPHGF